MVKPFYTAIVAASVVFSTTLLVVAQQSPSLNNPVAGHTVAGSTATNPLAGNADAIQAGGRIFGQVREKCHGPGAKVTPLLLRRSTKDEQEKLVESEHMIDVEMPSTAPRATVQR